MDSQHDMAWNRNYYDWTCNSNCMFQGQEVQSVIHNGGRGMIESWDEKEKKAVRMLVIKPKTLGIIIASWFGIGVLTGYMLFP